ncbi:ADP-ribosylglycohydrolase [Arthrobacter sp. MN05-02]|nr:ADP-ribosylglycohydrolase [Arthrobacter sp. MN05-02]
MTTDSTAGSGPGDTTTGTYEDRVLGCLLGTMAGDAYGILTAAGDDPATALDEPGAVAVSDATQLTLYTVDALVEALEWANDGVAADETACVWLAYLRWLTRQGEHLPPNAPVPPPRWLDRQEELTAVHDPDAETVRALLTGDMGTAARPLNPRAQGPGALMRSAPFGLVPRIPASMVERLTVDAAALTHGSQAARATAALLSAVIRSLAIEGTTLDEAVATARAGERIAAEDAGHDAGRGLAGGADTSGAGADGAAADGATAAGTFEAALQAVVEGADESSSPRDHLVAALGHAAHAGRPDASPMVAASLAGGIVGALHGTRALPAGYLTSPGVPAVVRSMARTLLSATTGT